LVRECSSALLILSTIAIFNIFSSSLSSLAFANSSEPFLRAQAFVVTAKQKYYFSNNNKEKSYINLRNVAAAFIGSELIALLPEP
jgi:hypothetical protein